MGDHRLEIKRKPIFSSTLAIWNQMPKKKSAEFRVAELCFSGGGGYPYRARHGSCGLMMKLMLKLSDCWWNVSPCVAVVASRCCCCDAAAAGAPTPPTWQRAWCRMRADGDDDALRNQAATDRVPRLPAPRLRMALDDDDGEIEDDQNSAAAISFAA